ncbi:MAG: hypoxanthine phosphoribosyltransferase [Clostridia bacterium]|nr:hypoxanthine phosphoribosyltransferase [Clostridia bacterium]MBQ4543150.1 hypoxanthine phosphoribosyltransferase [Clostridia bacterium]MBQ9997630.1 hypoxanthine phosphoribosyltransferase [Clostridia bacterium]
MNKNVERILFTEEQLKNRVSEMAQEINKHFNGEPVVVVSVLKGSVVFAVDLIKQLDMPVSLDFICASSYGSGTISSGKLIIKKDVELQVEGQNILLLEDIIDTGETLHEIMKMLKGRGAKSIVTAMMFNKPARRKKAVQADFIGFDIPDEFVVGYGLDYDEQYRNLPYLGVLKRSVYEK